MKQPTTVRVVRLVLLVALAGGVFVAPSCSKRRARSDTPGAGASPQSEDLAAVLRDWNRELVAIGLAGDVVLVGLPADDSGKVGTQSLDAEARFKRMLDLAHRAHEARRQGPLLSVDEGASLDVPAPERLASWIVTTASTYRDSMRAVEASIPEITVRLGSQLPPEFPHELLEAFATELVRRRSVDYSLVGRMSSSDQSTRASADRDWGRFESYAKAYHERFPDGPRAARSGARDRWAKESAQRLADEIIGSPSRTSRDARQKTRAAFLEAWEKNRHVSQ
jgi:hypothetical protein